MALSVINCDTARLIRCFFFPHATHESKIAAISRAVLATVMKESSSAGFSGFPANRIKQGKIENRRRRTVSKEVGKQFRRMNRAICYRVYNSLKRTKIITEADSHRKSVFVKSFPNYFCLDDQVSLFR